MAASNSNGPSGAPNGTVAPGSAGLMSTRMDVIDTAHGRILCVSDIRGKLSHLNALAQEHGAKAIIHAGDFGFYNVNSLDRIAERTLRHLIQYSNLISSQFRQQLLHNPTQVSFAEMRRLLRESGSHPDGFALSEFNKLLTGELKLTVPVYTVWGACEDVEILERLRSAPPGEIKIDPSNDKSKTTGPAHGENWSIPNLTVLSEGTTRVLNIGGIRLRLFGLGGAVVGHKLFDNGEGQATIAGGSGTMWTTILQIGELVDTAQRVFDEKETRLLVTHASPGREGLLAQLALVLKADLTISAGLHFRYGVSYNEFSVQHDHDNYRVKLEAAKKAFDEIWSTVQHQVESVIDDQQRKFLNNALTVTSRVPPQSAPAGAAGGAASEEPAWKNSWNWNLPDASFGNLILKIHDGRVNSEMNSQGFNFAYRAQSGGKGGPPQASSTVGPSSNQPQRPAPSTSRPSGPPPPKKDGPDADAGPSSNRGPGPKPPQQPRNPSSQQQQNRANGPAAANKTSTPEGWSTDAAAAKSSESTDKVVTGWGDSNEPTPSLSALAGQDASASSNANAPPPPSHHRGDGDHPNRGAGRGRGGPRGRGGNGPSEGGPRGRGGRGRGGNNNAAPASGNASPAPPAAAPTPAANGA